MNTWLCRKCNTYNKNEINRCGFCSNPKPENIEAQEIAIQENTENKLKNDLHNIIEKMPHNARIKTFRWLEDWFL